MARPSFTVDGERYTIGSEALKSFLKNPIDLRSSSQLAASSPSPAKGGGKGPPTGGGGEETAGNNLSFPVYVVDGASPITSLAQETFTVPYTGSYPAELVESGPWYAQKVEGNAWQAGFVNATSGVDIEGVDWGDNIESVNPRVGRPFRLEVTLYNNITGNELHGHTMAVLANPSSSTEVQGTNIDEYTSSWATVTSDQPKLVIQKIPTGLDDLTGLTWTGSYWGQLDPNLVNDPVVGFGFGAELNVGGKYVFGASEGGWKPTEAGKYLITFYVPESSNVDFVRGTTTIGNYTPENGFVALSAGSKATPYVLADVQGSDGGTYDMTCVQVTVLGGGGSGGGRRRDLVTSSDPLEPKAALNVPSLNEI